MKRWLALSFLILVCACQPLAATSTSSPTPTATNQPTQTPSATPNPTPTATKIPPSSTPTEQQFTVCCPLEDETVDSLPLIMVNPLVRSPHFGQDFGHPGLDFAYYQRGDRASIQGIRIFSIMTGKVLLTLGDSYPYGNAIIIETPLSNLPEALQDVLMSSYEPVPEDLVYQYNCPNIQPPTASGAYSLYHLYAHMEKPAELKPGDPISCGDFLGTVGTTGYSSNPHLHLETRLGPSGSEMRTMTHYKISATEEQLSNYCLWRSSGYYQIIDPYLLLNYNVESEPD